MTDKKIALARMFRILLVLCLFFVIAVTIRYFFSHRRPPSVEVTKIKDITEQKVEKQEGIEHYDFKGDRVYRAKAEKYYAGSDSLYYLEGNVEIREINNGGDKERIIRGDKITYDKDWNEVILEGQASLEEGDLVVKGPALFYRKNPETLSTDKGAIFSSKRISGRARQLFYSFAEESLRLEGDVEIQLRHGPESPDALVAKGDLFIYKRAENTGSATGKVTFSLKKNHGQADSLEFKLTPDEQQVERIDLKGDVKVFLVAEEEVPITEGDLLLAKAREREVEAEEISLNAFPDLPEMESLAARGNCFMKSVAASGSLAEVRSEAMKMLFDRQGGLREFRAWNKARLLEKEKDGSFKRLLSGQEILVESQGEKLGVRADASEEALLDSPESEVVAREIRLFPQEEIMEAAAEVKAILKAQPDKAETVGFFAQEKPVFITAQSMRYEQKQNRLIFRGDIRMWQDKDMLLAQQMTVLKDTGGIVGEGLVRFVFSLRPKKNEDKEERAELGGEKMNYNPKANLLTFEPASWLKTRNVSLKANSLFVSLAEKSADIQIIKARGKVVVADELREGQSEEALYDLSEETLVLTGNPVVTDKEKGDLRGDKLTFRLGDDRILVENKKKERSITVIKREQ
jgi:lipopolysaccharide export system protein LptA